jgi:hypothetical protein
MYLCSSAAAQAVQCKNNETLRTHRASHLHLENLHCEPVSGLVVLRCTTLCYQHKQPAHFRLTWCVLGGLVALVDLLEDSVGVLVAVAHHVLQAAAAAAKQQQQQQSSRGADSACSSTTWSLQNFPLQTLGHISSVPTSWLATMLVARVSAAPQ